MTSISISYAEMERHLLQDRQPSLYFNNICKLRAFALYPFSMLLELQETPQSAQYHPEGNVWNHTMLVVDEAAKVRDKSCDARVFMWAALLHDIGKPGTTRIRGSKVTAYDHEKLGAELARKFLLALTDDSAFMERVAVLIRWHMQILFVVKGLPFAEIETMGREADINEIALLGLCDRLGRTNSNRTLEEKNIEIFVSKCGHRPTKI
ncbi:MAG: HDIG domain-containing metalloprotein [Bacillota bacterium]|jgi:putative nucleotidyltransferase with HDIG domain